MPVATKPPGDRTGFPHPECYAAALADCSHALSREHYISNSLLSRMGDQLVVKGMPWCIEPKTVSPRALTGWILCERHNNALSGLDGRIVELVDLIVAWRRDEEIGDREFDGEDLERWAVKTWLGITLSGNVQDPGGHGKLRTRPVPEDYLRFLFGERPMPEGGGLYLKRDPAPNPALPGGFSFGIATSPDERQLIGIQIWIFDVSFLVSLVKIRGEERYRPSEIDLEGSGTLILRWPAPYRGDAYVLRKPSLP